MHNLTMTTQAQKGFYPTPPQLAAKLLEGIDWDYVAAILEPSAGKGNLLLGVAEELETHRRYGREGIDMDAIEIDPYLRSILQYEFNGQHEHEMKARLHVLSKKQVYDRELGGRKPLSPQEAAEEKQLEHELSLREAVSVHLVHDDFLTFDSRKQYSLIVMNPPFENGDEHLLKAIAIQERYGGLIRCILNAETLHNPYTNRRKILREKLSELNAEIEYVDDAFVDSERPTDVSVAIIRINIPAPQHESTIFERLRTAAHIDECVPNDITDMAVTDFLSQIVTYFNVEVDAGLKLIQEYMAMRPYLMASFDRKDSLREPTLTLCVGDPHSSYRSDTPSMNQFLRLTRAKYWEALFSNKEFIGRLTSNLRDKYRGMVQKLKDYDFTLFNIQQIMIQMNAEMGQGIQDTIVALFDRMTEEHSWYPEMQKNIHYYNGWKTNKVHKINNKVILPCDGVFGDSYWEHNEFKVRTAEYIISDIEKVFDYLDGNMTASVDLHWVLEQACATGKTKNIPCKYFTVTFYKKGTMHIRFSNQDLVDRFNIYCCRKKNWLPPNYGRSSYQDMTPEEKTVVDGFHGDGSKGTGEVAYSRVFSHAEYFLAEPTRAVPELMA